MPLPYDPLLQRTVAGSIIYEPLHIPSLLVLRTSSCDTCNFCVAFVTVVDFVTVLHVPECRCEAFQFLFVSEHAQSI